MMTDPIADMLTRIRNGSKAQIDIVEMPSSKFKVSIARILRDEGYVDDFEVKSEGPKSTLRIALKYSEEREPTIHGIQRISKPGLRVFAKRKGSRRVLGGLGTAIVSTSQGLMTGTEAARKRVGGEVIAHIW